MSTAAAAIIIIIIIIELQYMLASHQANSAAVMFRYVFYNLLWYFMCVCAQNGDADVVCALSLSCC